MKKENERKNEEREEKNDTNNDSLEEKRLKEIKKEMLKEAEQKLQEIKGNLDYLMEVTGAKQRYEEIREEIKERGWEYISKTYHPDVNCDDPAAVPLYAFYKFVYEDMIKRGEL